MSETLAGFDSDTQAPRSLRDPVERVRRKAMLDLPHVKPLADYAATLRLREGAEVPDFDPLDGGITAQVLFLLEKPGPMTSETGRRTGSGFVSRDNDDPTAAATWRFMRQAGIARSATVIWNVIPWWNGTIALTRAELAAGMACLPDLLRRLPHLKAVVMVGRRAGMAQPYLQTTGLGLFRSAHPSPQVRAAWPDRWNDIPRAWSEILPLLRHG